MGKFADSVDPSSFKAINSPEYIFLCGGKLDDLDHSLRAQFYERKVKTDTVLAQRVKLAEEADRWYLTRRLFDDLLELEEYLAALSACILLFVESPGAIAELGVFTQIPALRDKLIVVIEQSHSRGPSFIVNGPIEQMIRRNPQSVLSLPWLVDPTGADRTRVNTGALDDTMETIIQDLQESLKKRPKSSAFQRDDHGHKMLLIADLIKLGAVSSQDEILDTLSSLRLPMNRAEITKSLYLLVELGIISTEKYGHVDYYFGIDSNPEFIWYAPKSPMDRLKLSERLLSDHPIIIGTEKRRALDAHKNRSPAGVA